MAWTRTGVAVATLAPGAVREVLVGAATLLVVRVGDEVRVVDPYCPHAGGVLAEGTLDGPRLTCPVHAAVFDARTGAVLEDPFGVSPPEGGVDPLGTYPVRVVDGMLEVELP